MKKKSSSENVVVQVLSLKLELQYKPSWKDNLVATLESYSLCLSVGQSYLHFVL